MFALPHGLTNALTVKLEHAVGSWQRGNGTAGVNQLRAFVHQVHAQTGKKLTGTQADELVAIATVILDAIESGPAM
jgi:hypothetical protein